MTDPVARLLDVYAAYDAAEAADVARLREALATRDVLSRSVSLHVTGSALVVHPPTRRVLLRWHPRMAMWMQVGGHFDADETDPWIVALREAREETGLTDLRDAMGSHSPVPIQIVIVPVPTHGDELAHEHADFRYLLETDDPDAVVPESDAALLRWVDLDIAVAEATEDNLRVFLSRASEEIT